MFRITRRKLLAFQLSGSLDLQVVDEPMACKFHMTIPVWWEAGTRPEEWINTNINMVVICCNTIWYCQLLIACCNCNFLQFATGCGFSSTHQTPASWIHLIPPSMPPRPCHHTLQCSVQLPLMGAGEVEDEGWTHPPSRTNREGRVTKRWPPAAKDILSMERTSGICWDDHSIFIP